MGQQNFQCGHEKSGHEKRGQESGNFNVFTLFCFYGHRKWSIKKYWNYLQAGKKLYSEYSNTSLERI